MQRDGNRFILELRKWVKGLQTPVGIHATSDINCRYLIEICKSLELKIPHDLAIVGSGNEPLICNSPYPSITSIDKNFEEVGYQAAKLLDEMMKKWEEFKPKLNIANLRESFPDSLLILMHPITPKLLWHFDTLLNQPITGSR